MITVDQIQKRMMDGLFRQRLMDNSFRGIWCEYMVAEALGPECRTVGSGWNAWDLQIGESEHVFPKRIRIQVKNSARLQSWNAETGKESVCEFHLKHRKRPFYFEQNNKDVPCEAYGFLCEVYVLCWHNEVGERADHRDLSQWKFFIVPVVGPNTAVTERELKGLRNEPVTLKRRPDTLAKGIGAHQPIRPIGIDELTVDRVRKALGLQ